MTVEEFAKATEEELRQKANERLALLDEVGIYVRPGLLMEAQLYLSEIERRGAHSTATRDLVLEVIVIMLILAEIVFGVIGGNHQVSVLQQLNTSTSATATALRSLVDQQGKSADTQAQTLSTISSMNSAMQNQLAILKKEQEQRLAELAKQPQIELLVGGINMGTLLHEPVPLLESTSTQTTWEITLKNTGAATARGITFKVGTPATGVTLSTDAPSMPLHIPAGTHEQVILVPMARILAGEFTILNLTARYPRGTKVFTVEFAIDGDNVPAESLGQVVAHPPQVP